ncbi:V-type ATP synthase subunit A [Marispirochaeta aestuarii]|uniref:V-type ATP synthase alpha chain n=1 Tax=Marispirochaeta aestuarii TaxID=1963862 RepID=A0A1Y1RVP2_9SPIO|nr:V-type ATP synthase subunit A [Marispirochaeta aestuarii]ORC34044.1 V-type ATP synthase subunit A [Marispirochaeta aestuarii]
MSKKEADRIIGRVRRVNGPVVEAEGITDAGMLEMVEVGEVRIVGEVTKLSGSRGIIQVYEDTTGIRPGENIYGSGMPLSVELGPGLLGTIYDGIQRPLEEIYKISREYISRGISVPSLNRDRSWSYTPLLKEGEALTEGRIIGTVQETEQVLHRIPAPPDCSGRIVWAAGAGEYRVEDVILKVETASGLRELSMVQRWPIRKARPSGGRLPLATPLITGQRVIDTLFPLAKGGTVSIPGGFGTGKTMTQHAIAKWCDADIIVYIGCGERGNEMTDVLTEFPRLVDPRSGLSLMNRTILIANTSNMPVSAREASIYTGVTLAEYYRDQGYHVAIMADSTSRWAEALRELSGRMEEMPAEEGFPAYLPTRIAEFYERAGYMETLGHEEGSVTIIGAVSPPGGDFSEPVTQHTRRFVRCFWGLDRQLANARHYPAISWLDSYSEYLNDVLPWWEERVGSAWKEDRREMLDLLQREVRLQQVVKLVGPDALPDSQRFVIEVCSVFKNAFLQQNAFDDIDRFSTVEKQQRMLELILLYWRRGNEAIRRGVTLVKLRRMKVLQEIIKMKFTVANEDVESIDRLAARLERSIDKLEAIYV